MALTPYIRFHRLKEKWEAETAFLSSVSDIVMHPAYQQIIGMGPVSIPLILREMSIKQGQWFWALKSITNEDPETFAQPAYSSPRRKPGSRRS